MRRKPSASHCVKKLPPDTYRPDSVVFAAGLQMLVSVSSKLSGTLSSGRPCSCACALANGWPSISALTNSSCSPISSRCDARDASGLRRTRIVFLTTVRSGTRSNSSATVSIRKAGGA